MNAYIADRIARDHADQLMSDAAALARARRVRKSRRAALHRIHTRPTTDRAAAHPGAAAAHFVARPFVALHDWLVAGEI